MADNRSLRPLPEDCHPQPMPLQSHDYPDRHADVVALCPSRAQHRPLHPALLLQLPMVDFDPPHKLSVFPPLHPPFPRRWLPNVPSRRPWRHTGTRAPIHHPLAKQRCRSPPHKRYRDNPLPAELGHIHLIPDHRHRAGERQPFDNLTQFVRYTAWLRTIRVTGTP